MWLRTRGRSSTRWTSCATRSTRARRGHRDRPAGPGGPRDPPRPGADSNTSGCEASTSPASQPAAIALCSADLRLRRQVPERAGRGRGRVIIMNEGQPGRTGLLNMIGDATACRIPRCFVRGGLNLAQTPGATVRSPSTSSPRSVRPGTWSPRRQRQRRQRRDGGRAPRRRPGRRGHQRQRLGQRHAARDRDPDGEDAAADPSASPGGAPRRSGLLGSEHYVD